jgi:DNA primase
MLSKEELFSYNETFKANLSSAESGEAIRYLKSRKISWDTVELFNLGYSTIKKSTPELPYFENTITIPSFNLSGDIVSIRGRKIDNGHPKYTINKNCDTKNSIFGLYQAQKSIVSKKFAIITEGIFDCISMVQAGFSNTIASPGSTWGDFQLVNLCRYTNNVILIFDNDSVGEKKGKEIVNRLKLLDFYAVKMNIPQRYKDIDEYIKSDENSVEYLRDQISKISNT